MSRHAVLLVVALAGVVGWHGKSHGAATLVPDHTFRLGRCGGPQGAPCTWQCGVGKSCAGGSTCALEGVQAFGGVLETQADDGPCGGSGVVLKLGLAGVSEGTPFQIPATAFDLCGRDIGCTGREPRACVAECADDDPAHLLCGSDDGQGNFPCPPGDVMFFCKDPCASSSPIFDESDLDILSAWFSETRQPLPDVTRAALVGALPSPPSVGRPVVYFAQQQLFPLGDPPHGRICVRVAFTSQDAPLGACSNDARTPCAQDGDCPGGTCVSGTPPSLNPAEPDAVVSTSTCNAGSRLGRPCGDDGDCDSIANSCVALPATSASRFCSVSGTACVLDTDCDFPEVCESCPTPSCGDGVLDPGEGCDDGGQLAGDGCDASCTVETCWTCDRTLGELTDCVASTAGTPCDLDGQPCTFDQCTGFGQCTAGGAPPACAGAAAAQVQIKTKDDDPAKGNFKWKWSSLADFDVGSLGDPATTDAMSVCAYDQNGLRLAATAPAGGLCRGEPCWTATDEKVTYKDKDAIPDGLTKILAKSGAAGKGKLKVIGKGEHLVLPPIPLAPPLQVLLLRGNGPSCWSATFPIATKNEDGKFKAKVE
jgi:cysteine-rich repeat protein